MARALLTSRAHAVLALAFAFACNSDEPLDSTTEIDLSTGEALTEGIPFTTGPSNDESTGSEPDDPNQSCHKSIECVAGCFTKQGSSEEEDLSCYEICLEGLTTQEVLAMIALARCVYDDCFARMICTEHGVDDDDDCQKCVVIDGLLAINPPAACEAETLACK